MRLGQVLGIESRKELERHALASERKLARQRKKLIEAENNRRKNKGQIIKYERDQE